MNEIKIQTFLLANATAAEAIDFVGRKSLSSAKNTHTPTNQMKSYRERLDGIPKERNYNLITGSDLVIHLLFQ